MVLLCSSSFPRKITCHYFSLYVERDWYKQSLLLQVLAVDDITEGSTDLLWGLRELDAKVLPSSSTGTGTAFSGQWECPWLCLPRTCVYPYRDDSCNYGKHMENRMNKVWTCCFESRGNNILMTHSIPVNKDWKILISSSDCEDSEYFRKCFGGNCCSWYYYKLNPWSFTSLHSWCYGSVRKQCCFHCLFPNTVFLPFPA